MRLICVLAMLAAVSAFSQVVTRFEWVVPGSPWDVMPMAIDDRGRVVGELFSVLTDQGGPAQAFFDDGALSWLNTPHGTPYSGAEGMASCADGSLVIVGWFVPSYYQHSHACTWRDGSLVDLGVYEDADTGARDTRCDGVVVGGCTLPDLTSRGLVWQPNGDIQQLRPFGMEDCSIAAIGGGIAGTVHLPEGFRAYLFDGANYTNLGTLGGTYSRAADVNAAGHVVGDADVADASWHAFLFDGRQMNDIHYLGAVDSSAQGINDRGQVVGWYDTVDDFRSFVYLRGEHYDLADLAAAYLPASVKLRGCSAISNSGWITGTGIELDPHSPGFFRLRIQPRLSGHVLGESYVGTYGAGWHFWPIQFTLTDTGQSLLVDPNPDSTYSATMPEWGTHAIVYEARYWLSVKTTIDLDSTADLDLYFPYNGDVDGDDSIGLKDLSIVLADFGHHEFTGGDVTGDGRVGIADLSIILSNFGMVGEE